MPINSLTSMAMNNIIWVDSEQHARNSPVAFGHSVLFMDKNDEKFYIKSVDQSGVMTAFRRFERIEITDPVPENFVSREDFDKLQNRIENLMAQIEAMNAAQNVTVETALQQNPPKQTKQFTGNNNARRINNGQ